MASAAEASSGMTKGSSVFILRMCGPWRAASSRWVSANRLLLVPLFGGGSGQGLDARLIARKLGGRSGMDDGTVIEHVGIVRNLEAHADILLHQQDRDAVAAHLGDDAENLAHDERREALRGLV